MRLVLLLLAVSTSIARAEPRVAVIERARFEEEGGIARWLAARQQLDLEQKSFRYVESPDGKPLPVDAYCKPPIEDFRKETCVELKKLGLQRVAEAAWKLHEAEVLDPIAADLDKAVAGFARSRGIELVLEKDETGIVYMAPGVDITAGFIKDYNAKHPVVKPKPQPKR